MSFRGSGWLVRPASHDGKAPRDLPWLGQPGICFALAVAVASVALRLNDAPLPSSHCRDESVPWRLSSGRPVGCQALDHCRLLLERCADEGLAHYQVIPWQSPSVAAGLSKSAAKQTDWQTLAADLRQRLDQAALQPTVEAALERRTFRGHDCLEFRLVSEPSAPEPGVLRVYFDAAHGRPVACTWEALPSPADAVSTRTARPLAREWTIIPEIAARPSLVR